MNKSSNVLYYSSTSTADKEDRSPKDNEKLQSQIECLKKNLRSKSEELKRQEDLTKTLEEELTKAKTVLCEFNKQDQQSMLCVASSSHLCATCCESALFSVVSKIEEILQELQEKNKSDVGLCKSTIVKEVEKVRSIKKTLEKSRCLNLSFRSCDMSLSKKSDDRDSCCVPRTKYHSDSELTNSYCEYSQFPKEIEMFREKALMGVVVLEHMKEQVDILENLIKKNVEKLDDGDKTPVENCENKLGKLRKEFDDITYQLCQILQKLNKNTFTGESFSSLSRDTVNFKEEDMVSMHILYSPEEVTKVKCIYQRLQKQVCDQENASEKLKIESRQLEEEIQQKKQELKEHCREMNSRLCETFKLRELVRKINNRLKGSQSSPSKSCEQEDGPDATRSFSLCCLFTDLQELKCTLENSLTALDDPQKLTEDNEKLKEKIKCLEKYICNKEETLRHLQNTVKLRESKIEELKFKMQTSESQISKLTQDVEEKCRLIASLQDAVRKCKELEVNMEEVESLQFGYCELECKLEKCKKEILLRDQKLESLNNELTNLTSKNILLTEKLSVMDPKLKIMYKTSHLFEKTVTDLEEELGHRECEIETLYTKIKELEAELESEFKKCENRALEDSKCIEELSLTVKNFQNELYSSQESYNMSIIEAENKLQKKMEMREAELNNTICCLKAEIIDLQAQLQDSSYKSKKFLTSNMDCMYNQEESHEEFYEKKIKELQKALECVTEEHENERKSILEKLCEEKKENSQNKSLITKLNESMKRKIQTETNLKNSIDRLVEENENLKSENQELKTEIEARKKIMSAMEKEDGANLADLEELICSLKIQKAELRAKCCNLKAEAEKEVKLKKLLECRVEDLNSLLQSKMQKFNEIVENYKCSAIKIQQTFERMREIEENLICSQNNTRRSSYGNEFDDYNNLKKLLDIKTAENAKLICQIQVLKVEIESIESEHAGLEADKDTIISRLQNEIECLTCDLQDFQGKWQKANDENKKLQRELDCWAEKATAMQNEFRERQKDLCGKLRSTICEKNDLLNSLDELQKQLEQICLENVNKEKVNQELSQECSKLKIKVDPSDTYMKNKSDRAICNFSTKEVKNLRCELAEMKDNYNTLNEEYQALTEQYRCLEKKKCNLEKLYVEVNNENKELLELKENLEREACELRSQNLLLKEMMATLGEGGKNVEEKKKLCDKIRDLTLRIKTLEKKVIPNLEQEISNKICCINNLKAELREANISSQLMRAEALKVIEHTKKYLSAQRCANETLKSRLECSNKRGNMLGIENRELEEQLKAVTRMNEFLLRQLQSVKDINEEADPRSYSPLPWGCPIVERDTSSSEYLAESGFQSMQPSPTNMDYDYEPYYDSKRNNGQWGSTKKNKCGVSVEFLSYRNGVR